MITADYVDDISNGDPAWEKVDNRYTKIHVLFRELALKKDLTLKRFFLSKERNRKNISRNAIKIKQFWKDFFGIDSLTDLSDKELHDLEHFIEQRIKAENKKHD